MPQISIIKYSYIQKARRFDAEYFKPEYLKVERKLKNKDHYTMESILGNKNVFSGPFGSTLKSDSYQDFGVPFIRISDIQDIFIKQEKLVYISEGESERLNSTTLNIDDIVLSKIGTIGRLSLISSELGKVNISENNVGLRLEKLTKEQKRYLLFFLLSKYGQSQILRTGSGNVQLKFNVKDINNLIIPNFPLVGLDKLSNLYDDITQKHTQSKELYKEAEELLLTELGLVNYKPKQILAFETTKKEIVQADRYDAEYFQPKYAEIIKRIENYEGGFDRVENILNFNKKNFFPKINERYTYIPLSKVSNNGEIEIPEKELGQDLPTRARRRIKEGEVVLSSISGSLETSAIINKEHEGFIASNGFYVFSSDKINAESLLVLFKSKIMIELLQRISKGAILGGYDLTAFEQIKIPLINLKIQKQIAEKVRQSHNLRKESKELLEQAKTKVEKEIEK